MHNPYHRGFFYPLIFPFKEQGWFGRFWWLVLLTLIPILDFVLLRGWRLLLVKNMAMGKESILPTADIGNMFKYGLVLWLMTGFYVIIPTIIIFSVGAGELGNLIAAIGCIWNSVFGSEADIGLYPCLKAEAHDLAIRVSIEVVWLLVSGTLYRIAMIRYAITGKKRVFLNLPFNALLALRYLGTFIFMWLFGIVLAIFFFVLATAMSFTIVLAPFVPLVILLVYYYSTGYEFGALAYKMNRRKVVSGREGEDELLEGA